MSKVNFSRYSKEATYNTHKSAGQIPDGTLFIIGDTEKIGYRFGQSYVLIGIKDLENEIAKLRSDFDGQNKKLEVRIRGN